MIFEVEEEEPVLVKNITRYSHEPGLAVYSDWIKSQSEVKFVVDPLNEFLLANECKVSNVQRE